MLIILIMVYLQCTTTCGAGIQQRKVVCRLGHGNIVPDSMCLGGKRPRGERKCSNKECAQYMWDVGKWSEVSYHSIFFPFSELSLNILVVFF